VLEAFYLHVSVCNRLFSLLLGLVQLFQEVLDVVVCICKLVLQSLAVFDLVVKLGFQAIVVADMLLYR
jgi:hypothetical protein